MARAFRAGSKGTSTPVARKGSAVPGRPLAVMMSRRANVFYLERVRIQQFDERVVFCTQTGEPMERLFNLPERNTSLLLLGKGTSITDAAARKLADANVMIGFCGSGGTPLLSAVDFVFLGSVSEYRPPEYMQSWAKMWFDESARLQGGRRLLETRVAWTKGWWSSDLAAAAPAVSAAGEDLLRAIQHASSAEMLLLGEARWAKRLYALLAHAHSVGFSRAPGAGRLGSRGTTPEKKRAAPQTDSATSSVEELREEEASAPLMTRINGLLDHGNYMAYGMAAVALQVLGISFSFPLLHGKTRRGGLVFDIADLIKDGIVMPWAFEAGARGLTDTAFRAGLVERFQKEEVLDRLIGFLQDMCAGSR